MINAFILCDLFENREGSFNYTHKATDTIISPQYTHIHTHTHTRLLESHMARSPMALVLMYKQDKSKSSSCKRSVTISQEGYIY